MHSASSSTRLTTRFVAAAALCVLFSNATADLANGFDAAMSAAERSDEDKARDAARKPKEVLDFVGIGAGIGI